MSIFTGVNEFRWFLSQFSTDFHNILRTLYSSDAIAANILKI